MKANLMAFTERSILNIPFPESGTLVYKDTRFKYLHLYVSLNSKVFYYIRKINGRVRFIKIDSFPAISFQKAKDETIEYNALILKGIDPAAAKKEQKKDMTLSELFELYAEAKKHDKRTLVEDERKLNTALAPFKDKSISNITNRELDKFHKSLSETPYAANRTIMLVSALYTFANKKLRLNIENPAIGISKFEESERKRFLNPDELKRFIDVLNKWEEFPNRSEYADLFKLLIYTGQRKSNVLQMEFSEIDFNNEMWTIPATKAKNKKEKPVPLQQEPMTILKYRYDRLKNKSKYVFTSPKNPNEHLIEPKRQWDNLLKEAQLSELVIHDLRRSLASYLVMNGTDMKTVSEILGNSLKVCNKHYAFLLSDHKRKALENVFSNL